VLLRTGLLPLLAALALPMPCLAQNSAVASPPQGATIMMILVPAGTAVPLHVVGNVSSGSAKVDELFQVQVAEDVVINDMIVFRKGSGGQGHIVESDSAGGNGHSGVIAFALDYIYATDGGRVRLSQAPQKQAEEDRKGASSTATIIGIATFGVGGLFGHNLAHGRQKTMDPKTVISAFVADNVHVGTSEHAIAVRYDK